MPAVVHFPANRSSVLSRMIRSVFDHGLYGWILTVHIGPGAGYGRWILNRRLFIPTGWTLWIGHNVHGGDGHDLYKDRPFSMGITRNGNAAPYVTQ